MLSVPPAMIGVRRTALDAVGGKRDGLQTRRAEPVDRDGRRLYRQSRAKARDARDVQTLLGLGHGATEDDVLNVSRVDAGGAIQDLAHDGGGELIGARRVGASRSAPYRQEYEPQKQSARQPLKS